MSKGKRYKKENEKKENAELSEDLKGIEKEIVNKKKLPKEEELKINKKVFENFLLANIIMLFLYFINLGALNIDTEAFLTDLRAFSIALIVITILLFELSYKKDSGKLLLNGIECFVLALFTLFSIYIYSLYLREFDFVVAIVSLCFAIYYVVKATIIYVKMRRRYFASVNDISDIIKK